MSASRLDRDTRDPNGNVGWIFARHDLDSEDSGVDSSDDESEDTSDGEQ